MVLSYTNEVDNSFKKRMFWWYAKLKNIRLKIWLDPWLHFVICWMIFDAYLTEISKQGVDRKKLDYFYQNESDFKKQILKKENFLSGYGAKFKELSPINDMRPGSSGTASVVDENDVEQVFNFIYQIRCNLFHGAKDVKNEKDQQLVDYGSKFLREAISLWMGDN